ncbi:MAG: response regulator [Anaerolineales bacterium]|jgi:DNA-binding NarL/FixJ family response regulator
MDKTIHILLADDDYHVLSALRLVLEQEPTWQVLSEFHNAEELLHYLENGGSRVEHANNRKETGHSPILLIDWELPDFHPNNHIEKIRSLCPGIKILGLSVKMTARRDALASQVDAFVSKSDSPELVIAALRNLIS